MAERLSFAQIALLTFYALAMTSGQILFKLAALRTASLGHVGESLLALLQNGFFLSAVFLYAGLTVLWVWILMFTPLSRAYVFTALAFAVTPLAGAALFGEPISFRLVVGIGLIVGGLICIAG